MDTVEPGRRERKKQATRRHIAGTGVQLFLARGFDAVSVAEIAEAADVSKVTVFNHFPAKADMVLELAAERLADPARAVRDRAPGVSALEAIRDDFLAGIAAHAEWTGCHDGVQEFARMIWDSPTLLAAFARTAQVTGDALTAELARAAGEPPVAVPPVAAPVLPVPEGVDHPVVAAMISAAIRRLTDANVMRLLAGQSAAEAEPAARADAERAFALLGGGIGDFARRPVR